jgi:hypothetical protein
MQYVIYVRQYCGCESIVSSDCDGFSYFGILYVVCLALLYVRAPRWRLNSWTGLIRVIKNLSILRRGPVLQK